MFSSKIQELLRDFPGGDSTGANLNLIAACLLEFPIPPLPVEVCIRRAGDNESRVTYAGSHSLLVKALAAAIERGWKEDDTRRLAELDDLIIGFFLQTCGLEYQAERAHIALVEQTLARGEKEVTPLERCHLDEEHLGEFYELCCNMTRQIVHTYTPLLESTKDMRFAPWSLCRNVRPDEAGFVHDFVRYFATVVVCDQALECTPPASDANTSQTDTTSDPGVDEVERLKHELEDLPFSALLKRSRAHTVKKFGLICKNMPA